MIETLVGALVGGTFRLAPEVLKWFDRKGERSHELAMHEKAIAFKRLRSGLVPSWSKGSDSRYSMINARSETVATKPAYTARPFASGVA